MRGAGGSHDSLLGKVGAQSIDSLCALANQKIAGPVGHDGGLLILSFHGDEPPGRARRSFGDCLGMAMSFFCGFT